MNKVLFGISISLDGFLVRENRSLKFYIIQEGIPSVIPSEMCYLGWQESLEKSRELDEPKIPYAWSLKCFSITKSYEKSTH